jgi:hypothetical protein
MEGEKGLFSMEKEYYRSFLRQFAEYDALNLRDYKPVYTEHPINSFLDAGLDSPVPIAGSIDRIDSARNGGPGQYRIIDYKTGSVSHFKNDYMIPMKLFQGFIYAWSVKGEISRISYVSIEKNERQRVSDILPFCRGSLTVNNFREIWEQKTEEIKAVFKLIRDGDFKPKTLESDFGENILEFYKKFYEASGRVAVESEGKCTFCPFTPACQRSDKLFFSFI